MSPVQRQTARASRLRTRMKVGTSIMITYGYAMLAAALWTPLASGVPLRTANFALVVMGLALHALALYFAPRGQPE